MTPTTISGEPSRQNSQRSAPRSLTTRHEGQEQPQQHQQQQQQQQHQQQQEQKGSGRAEMEERTNRTSHDIPKRQQQEQQQEQQQKQDKGAEQGCSLADSRPPEDSNLKHLQKQPARQQHQQQQQQQEEAEQRSPHANLRPLSDSTTKQQQQQQQQPRGENVFKPLPKSDSTPMLSPATVSAQASESSTPTVAAIAPASPERFTRLSVGASSSYSNTLSTVDKSNELNDLAAAAKSETPQQAKKIVIEDDDDFGGAAAALFGNTNSDY
jgi:hypothetical protein